MTAEKMTKRALGVHLRSDSTSWQWRLKAPKDLRPFYTTEWACRCSLETSNLTEANARAVRLRADWDATFADQRKRLNPKPLERVTPAMGREFAAQYLHHMLAREEVRLDLSWRKSILMHSRVLGTVGMAGMADEFGISITEDTPGAREATAHYLSALTDTLTKKLPEQPPTPLTQPRGAIHRLRDAFKRWQLSDGVKLRKQSVRARELALELYERKSGNPPIDEVTADQGDEFKAWLMNESKTSKTAADRFTYVNALFEYARTLDWLDRNPWARIKKIQYETTTEGKAWTLHQVQELFALPLFTGYALPKTQGRAGADAAYWLPILALYTGARIGELVQLSVSDVKEVGGHWVIDFNTSNGKKLKNAASVRQTPMHSELKRLGLIEYVAAVRDANGENLWPALKFDKERPSVRFSRWFAEEPRNAVTGKPKLHDLRHTVETLLTEAGVASEIRDRLVGHANKGSEGNRTYSHPKIILRTSMELLRYPGLSLPRVYQVRPEDVSSKLR